MSGLIYSKTKVPDVLFLVGFGFLVGPVLGIFDRDVFVSIAPLMGIVSICIIIFDSGLSLNFRYWRGTFMKAAVLTIVTFITMTSLVGLAVNRFLPEYFSLLDGLLLGTMVAGVSTMAVTRSLESFRENLPDLESTLRLLNLESNMCDPVRVVWGISVIKLLMTPAAPIRDTFRDIVYTLVIGALIGLVIGLAWSEVLDRLRGKPYNYIITVAAVFPTYLLAETIAEEGGGPIATFFFGMVLTNYQQVTRWLGWDRRLKPDNGKIVEFNEEISFVLKAYYFVYIGLIATLTKEYLMISMGVILLLFIVRYVVASGVGRAMGLTREEGVLSKMVFSLGTTTLVLSQLPAVMDPERVYFMRPEIYSDLCIPIVLGTILFASIATPAIVRRRLKKY